MPVERFDDPAEEARQAKAFEETLGPLMLATGWDSMVTAMRDAENRTYAPGIIIRFQGRVNQSAEMVTSSIAISPEDTLALIEMLAEQVVISERAVMPPPD